jgi:hypothetical protein
MSNIQTAMLAPYAPSRLSVFGGFSHLTAAGSSGMSEGGMVNQFNRRV